MLTTKDPSVLALRTPFTKYSPTLSSRVTLQCIITSGTPSSIDWHFNNSPMRVEDNSRYSGGNINNPSLTITSVEQNDLGLYMCLASNEIVTINSDIIALLPVGAKPVVNVPETSYIQLAGQEITITCRIQSPNSPMQEVQWIFINHEGKRIEPVILSTSPPLKYRGSTTSNPSLTIMYLESSDAGQYSCRARSLIGTTVSDTSASLMIPEIPAVHISKSLYTVNLGDEITLECTTLSNIALQDVFWVKEINDTITTVVIGNRFYGSSILNPSLTISDVNNNDEGHYTCYASNTIGIGSSLPTPLNVTGNANITITELTTEGEMINGRSVTVICEAYVMYAEGTVFATWKLNNSVINPTNISRWKTETIPSNLNNERMQFRLIVLSLQTSDSGILTCGVSDGFIISEKTLSLNIIGKPIVSISPRTSTVTLGDTVNIYCTVVQSYSVLTSILWYKNGDTFNPNKGEVVIRLDNRHSKLVISGIQKNVQYECSGINNYGEGNRLISHISVIKPHIVYQYCPVDVDQFESLWVYTVENTLVINSCPGDRAGTVSRLCNSNGEWEEPNYSTCISEGLLTLNVETDFLKNGIEVKDVNNILVDLNKITEPDIPGDLTSGELDISSSILDNIASHAKEKTESISIDQLEIFVSSCDNLLVEKNIPSWKQLKQLNFTGVTAIAKAVTVYTKAYTNVNDSVFQRTVQKDQLVVQVGKVLYEDITFPKKTQVLPDWITESANQVTLSKDNFEGQQPVGYSTTYYRNISNLFHEYYLSEGSVTATNGSYDVNSVVIDFSIEPTPTSLQRPLVIKFEHVQVNYSNPVCAFWDFDALNTPNGAWSFSGSKLVTTSEGVTVCQYDHTTNFALLMSPGRASSSHSLVLSKISAAGCGISIVFLVVTVIIHAMLWRQLTCDTRGRKIKRDKAILLVNFCVALAISYILFLSGVTRTGNKKVCTTIAVLLHYIFLVDFAFMLAEGIEIAISVLFVFATSSRTKWLIPTCWVSPAVIVGISMGATKLDGYGNSQYCWLSVESNLIWAFVGPVLTVVLINLIILILVLRTMFATHAMMDKTTKERAKAGIRSLCVILPLFGVTWVLGVFSVNEDTVVFQYLFAVFNSLQGFFIFLFHTVLNQQIREGIQTMRVKKADKSSIYSKQSSQKTTRESFVTSTSESQRDSSESSSILRASKFDESLVTSIENNKHVNQNSLKGDNGIAPENYSKTTKDVHGPVKADNGKQTSVQNKSKSDGGNRKHQQSNDNKDVVLRRSQTVASGKQSQDGGKIHKKDQRRSQYNSRPESISVYYFDNPVMSNDQTRRPAVENPSSTFENERQRIPDEIQGQRGNKIRWSADC
ncbi:adhesion G protein-coupled receptor L3-like [Mytilus californianus]|uniref:adhesion G protein-coupled receptor L3-like n=1 Tax=Mytilus californianus TaxID=6549 RepID=UPI002247445B|nr:adhesion G protein-coupled receptor L3-like [Mytilus californianus]